jgi:hypothetical protein
MKCWIALASTMLCSIALIAVVAGPASARVPGGQGLESFGFATCGSLGQVEVFGPPAAPAPVGYLLIPDAPDPHVVATRFEFSVDGDVLFSKNFGEKAGLTTFTCTQANGAEVFTLTVAVIPPQ